MPLAMRPLCDQMAHCRRTTVQPSALIRSPRRSRGLTPCERLVSGSTSNKRASGLRTSRSEFSLFRLRKRDVVLKDAPNKCALVNGSTPNEITSCQVTSRSGCSLFRPRKSFRRAPKKFSSGSKTLYQAFRHKCAPPTRPMAAPARASTLAGTALLSGIFCPSLVLSRSCAEKFRGLRPLKFSRP